MPYTPVTTRRLSLLDLAVETGDGLDALRARREQLQRQADYCRAQMAELPLPEFMAWCQRLKQEWDDVAVVLQVLHETTDPLAAQRRIHELS